MNHQLKSEREFILWRDVDTFLSERGSIPTALLQAPAEAAPVLGLQTCGIVTASETAQADFLSLQLSILIKGRRPLRLSSNARCMHMLPWNLTDGRRHGRIVITPRFLEAGDFGNGLAPVR